jgi:dodecin
MAAATTANKMMIFFLSIDFCTCILGVNLCDVCLQCQNSLKTSLILTLFCVIVYLCFLHVHFLTQGVFMTVAKVIEITSSSKKSFEDAISTGIARASETIADIQGAWVQDQKVVVSKGKVTEYRVSMKVTFVLGGAKKK